MPPPQEYTIVTMTDRPDLKDVWDGITNHAWPEFMLHDPIANQYWHGLYDTFPDFQFAMLESDTERVIGVGNSIPLSIDPYPQILPDEGWDWAMTQGFEAALSGETPQVQCAISITIDAPFQGKGFSTRMVQAMREIGRQRGCKTLIAPVRPNQKTLYPLIPMDHYIQWQTPDGLPFDAWLRVHARLGADIISVCPQAMRIPGTITEWETWTGLHFPETGEYIIPGALNPVSFDVEQNLGVYVEPNVWMLHRIE